MSGKELDYIKEAFELNWIAPTGPHLTKFEEMVKNYVGSKYAVAVNSGTSAIHLALKALGVGKGDLILCSTLTFIGTVNPIIYEGAEPVFIDSNIETWNMNPLLMERAILELIENGKKPKAIIVVHVFGISADIDLIKKIADSYDIPIIEDAAESLGTTFNKKHTGTFGKIGVYSFNGNKLLSTSGGGILVTDDESIANHVRFLSTQAKDDFPYYHHTHIGYNYRMSNVLAAIGIGQMEVIEERIKRRREINKVYREELGNQILFLTEPDNSRSNMWLTCGIILPEIKPHDFMTRLNNHNIETRRVWKPMHQQPVLAEYKKYITGTSGFVFNSGICLPSGSSMTNEDLYFVIRKIKNILK